MPHVSNVNIRENGTGNSNKIPNPLQNPGALYIKVHSLESEDFYRAKRVLDIFEGSTPVIFYLSDEKRQVRAPRNMWVDINSVMIKELKYQLGDQNVVAK